MVVTRASSYSVELGEEQNTRVPTMSNYDADKAVGDSVDVVLKDLGSSKTGLSDSEVAAAQEKYGPNELPEEEGDTFWDLFKEQFEDPLVKILLAAAVVSFALAILEEKHGDEALTAYVEPFVILTILLANAFVGVWQEQSADAAIEALKKYSASEAKVKRNGKDWASVKASELVPGDVVQIKTGDQIPADLRVMHIDSTTLKIAQDILTGESESVSKQVEAIKSKISVPQDKKNFCFSGTNVAAGEAEGIVVAIGEETEMGKINKGLQKSDSDKEKTPLGKKIEEFGDQLCKAIAYICIAVWVINIPQFATYKDGWIIGAIYYFKIAVALAVAAIPEGLPAVITTCLALGTQRMAKNNALVRKLPSVETLGCTSVICSDKTGTLTTNQMSVSDFFVIESSSKLQKFAVSGGTYDPSDGEVTGEDGSKVDPASIPAVVELAKICSYCTSSSLEYKMDDEDKSAPGIYKKIGEATEVALLVLVEKLNVLKTKIGVTPPQDQALPCNEAIRATASKDKDNKEGFTLEFTRARKSMSVFVTEKQGKKTKMYVKGAWEAVLERCTHVLVGGKKVKITAAIKKLVEDQVLEYSTGSKTLRCLGFATVDDPGSFDKVSKMASDPDNFAKIESGMTFVGVTGTLDPPRTEVGPAIQKCYSAGVRVIVITGDNKNTAVAICKRIGVFAETDDTDHMAYTGAEFEEMSEDDKNKAVKHAKLFARVNPAHKQKIVDLLKKQGEVVAMTGDGVNDAPALKNAHIGIAMGSGTEVAKSASDMILADDNFASIVKAVEEGRAIYNNTKQFIRYLISSNIGEVVSIFLTAALGLPEALIPVQLLWVNLVTDGLPATALGFNPPDLDIMDKKPRSTEDKLISGWLFFRYMAIGLYVGVATVAGAAWWFMLAEDGPQLSYSQLSSFKACTPETFAAGYTNAASNFAAPCDGHEAPCNPCEVLFDRNEPKTMALSILVVIELLNALNSVSEDQSMLAMPPWRNMYLIAADLLSLALHFVILYVPLMATIFQLTPLDYNQWKWVLYLSFPVILMDEVMKFFARIQNAASAVGDKKQD
jgi:Ca2+ transporting ATPase